MDDRKTYLGGTDAAAILGLSRWKSPLMVYMEKTGNIEAPDISDKLAVKLGTRLEEVVAELFTEATGKKTRRVNETLRHPKFNFLGANIDRKVEGEDAVLEIKTASAWRAKEWAGEEIPFEYIAQVVHYLAVTGREKAYIAVLIGNQEFKWQEIKRDEKQITDYTKRAVAFWQDHVAAKKPPTEIMAIDTETLKLLYPTAAPLTEVDLSGDDDFNKACETREAFLQDKKTN